MKETLEHWNERARLAKSAEEITHFDTVQRKFEIEILLKYLNTGDTLLDLGCGNGYSSAFFKEKVKSVLGADFSEEMIKRARKEVSGNNLEFIQADARQFNLNKKFSKIITQRCLINILNWEEQQKAIHNIHAHLSEDGMLLMMEGSNDGREALNKLRIKTGLSELPKVEYNLDFKLELTNQFLSSLFEIKEYKTFGNYEYITRVIYPKYIYPEQPHYGSKFHEIAYEMVMNTDDKFPEISKLGLWILKKK